MEVSLVDINTPEISRSKFVSRIYNAFPTKSQKAAQNHRSFVNFPDQVSTFELLKRFFNFPLLTLKNDPFLKSRCHYLAFANDEFPLAKKIIRR